MSKSLKISLHLFLGLFAVVSLGLFVQPALAANSINGVNATWGSHTNAQGSTASSELSLTNTNSVTKNISFRLEKYWCSGVSSGHPGAVTDCYSNGNISNLTYSLAPGATVSSGVLSQAVGGNGTCGSAQVDIFYIVDGQEGGPYWGVAYLSPCQTQTSALPTVDLKANGSDGPITVPYGSTVNLSWTSTNAITCSAGGAWGGPKSTSGTETSIALTATRGFTIQCVNNNSDFVYDNVTVNVTPQQQLPTVDIKANGSDGPVTIASGDSASLSWTSNNASSCFASNAWTGSKATSGSESTGSLANSRTYTITCSNSVGSVSDSVTVNVNQVQLPTVDIKANGSDGPVTIAYNDSANLSWTSQNATSCFASNAWSGSKNLSGSESTNNLTNTRTYTITCSNSAGNVSDSVTVNVTPQTQLPTVDIKANSSDGPISIDYNSSATLSWSSTNATSCFASNAWSGSKGVSGAESTGALTSTHTYTITCSNSAGSASDSVTVNVGTQQQLPTVDIKANGSDGPVTIAYNGSATLSWVSSNAVSCNASNGWSGSKGLSGSETTGTLTASRTYTITCTNAVGSATDSVTVMPGQDNSLAVTLNANPTVVNSGGSSTLTWTSTNASYCYADGGPWTGTKSVPGGSEQVTNLTISRTFRITCVNSVGTTASADATVSVQAGNAPSVTIYAQPNPVISGNQSQLYWSSQNAVSCQASGGPWTGPKNLSGNEFTQSLYNATTYGITCQNSAGVIATAQVTVNVTNTGCQGYNCNNNIQPPTLNLYANPSVVPTGNPSTVYWSSTNADYCIASGDWSGNKQVSGSQQVGPINYTQNYILTCYGQGGSVVRNTTVSPQGYVLGTQAPTLTIYAIPTPVRYGSASTVYWNAQNVDQCSAIGNWYGNQPANGQYPTGPLFADSTYTLTCYGQGGTITRSAVVPVIAPPPVYVPPVYVGQVQGVTGSYGASIQKTITNNSTGQSGGTTVNARPGNELRYDITVRNTGTLTLTNLVVKDPLSDKVDVKTISDNGTYDYTNRTVTWKISRLAAGESKTVSLTVRVIQCDTDIVIENRASVDNSQISETTSNNTVAGVSTGPFTISIDNLTPTVAAGDKVTYTIHYQNAGSGTAYGAKLDVYIPSGMIIEGQSQNCTVTGNTVSLSMGDVAAGQSGQITVNGKIDPSVLPGEQLVTRAVVSYRDGTGATRQSEASTLSVVNGSGSANSNANSNSSSSSGTRGGLKFLPDTFFGWLLLLLLIIVLAIFIKRLLTKEDKTAAH